MDLYTLYEEWEDISFSRKVDALQAIVDFIKKNEIDELAIGIIERACDYEQDDYFGTEGLNF